MFISTLSFFTPKKYRFFMITVLVAIRVEQENQSQKQESRWYYSGMARNVGNSFLRVHYTVCLKFELGERFELISSWVGTRRILGMQFHYLVKNKLERKFSCNWTLVGVIWCQFRVQQHVVCSRFSYINIY